MFGEDFSTCQESPKNFGANFRADFGANIGENFGNIVSNFATFFGNFVQQKGGAKIFFIWKSRIGGVPGRGFSNSWICCVFFAKRSVIAREFLPEFDTSPAIATSVLRTAQLLREPPSWNTAIRISRFISRDTCSDSIAKLFRVCFSGRRGRIAQLSRDML